jgi:ABC-type multidrug transport system ATPase subunit
VTTGRSWGLVDVTVRYGARAALNRVSLSADPAGVVAVVGGDGAGKSTLIRTMAGLHRPAEGVVRIPGRNHIGLLSASSGIYPDLSVSENLEFAAAAYRVPAAVAARRTGVLLERTGLEAVRSRLAGDLSGGMRQKLGVVRAMLHEPDLLVLDEPTTGVDPISRADVWWLIATEAARGCAVVLATTYLDEAERAGHVLVLEGGESLVEGSPASIVAAVPGRIHTRTTRPRTDLAWRRRGSWREWDPAGPGGDGEVGPDLQDAVMVAALAKEARDG